MSTGNRGSGAGVDERRHGGERSGKPHRHRGREARRATGVFSLPERFWLYRDIGVWSAIGGQDIPSGMEESEKTLCKITDKLFLVSGGSGVGYTPMYLVNLPNNFSNNFELMWATRITASSSLTYITNLSSLDIIANTQGTLRWLKMGFVGQTPSKPSFPFSTVS